MQLETPQIPIPVLLIDDDPIFRESLKIVLGQFPQEWSCYCAESVEEAIEELANCQFKLAIVDVHLPDGNAADFIRRAGTLPCILCTQDNEEPTFKQMFNDGSVSHNIVGYLIKPLQQGVIWSIRAGLQIGQERQFRNRLVAEATTGLENERRQIAQNLHDSMGASLTQLTWILSGIDRAISEANIDTELANQITSFCAQGKQIVAEAHREMSEAVMMLRPEAISVAGLQVAIKYMLSQWEVTAPTVRFKLTCAVDLEEIIGEGRSGIIYRLIQEGITNAMRHTNATHVDVNISYRDKSLALSIVSKGRILVEKDTYKLTILKERTSSLGGILQFKCDANRQETCLNITIPL